MYSRDGGRSVPFTPIFVLQYSDVEIHRSARKHGIADAAIRHALDHATTFIPDKAGDLLEIIWLELADDITLVIHAMPLRPTFYDLLPQTREDMP